MPFLQSGNHSPTTMYEASQEGNYSPIFSNPDATVANISQQYCQAWFDFAHTKLYLQIKNRDVF